MALEVRYNLIQLFCHNWIVLRAAAYVSKCASSVVVSTFLYQPSWTLVLEDDAG